MKKPFSSFSCFLITPVWAQVDSGIIAGTVRGGGGPTIPKAIVTITETQTNFNVETDSQGDYVSQLLKVGTYSVSVENQWLDVGAFQDTVPYTSAPPDITSSSGPVCGTWTSGFEKSSL
jgi:hypothetical protein